MPVMPVMSARFAMTFSPRIALVLAGDDLRAGVFQRDLDEVFRAESFADLSAAHAARP